MSNDNSYLLDALNRRAAARKAAYTSRPAGYRRPAFGTPSYHSDYRSGWISNAEWMEDQAAQQGRAARARAGLGTVAPAPARWGRPAPRDSIQYAPEMATTAARDDRLTPQAKALLQVLHARCGKTRRTTTTKGTLGNIMRRCERSIQRYIAELVRFGYIKATVRSGRTGLYIGLVIEVLDKARPFYEQIEALGAWLARRGKGVMPWPTSSETDFRSFSEETELSPKNDSFYFIEADAPNGAKFSYG